MRSRYTQQLVIADFIPLFYWDDALSFLGVTQHCN